MTRPSTPTPLDVVLVLFLQLEHVSRLVLVQDFASGATSFAIMEINPCHSIPYSHANFSYFGSVGFCSGNIAILGRPIDRFCGTSVGETVF
jgi:hypothetical protein